MDATTLMTLMGLAGVTNPLNRQPGHANAQLDMAQPDAASGPTSAATPVQAPAYAPQGTPIAAPWNINSDTIPADPNPGAGIPNLAGMKPAGRKGGFSTDNILTALLGSNFGQ
jgi:hypothetical protein